MISRNRMLCVWFALNLYPAILGYPLNRIACVALVFAIPYFDHRDNNSTPRSKTPQEES